MKIKTPTLLLDKSKCLQNIARMTIKAQKHGIKLEPHFKTHQSGTIGSWYRDLGIEGITVSSVKMALYFASHGWRRITIAFPVNRLEVEAINKLARNIDLTIFVNSLSTAQYLNAHLNSSVQFFIEINTGYNRTGLDPSAVSAIEEIITESRKQSVLVFQGFYGHAGHTYGKKKSEIESIYGFSRRTLNVVKEKFRSVNQHTILSFGDTPGCSIINDFKGIDIIRPGNFVFFDLTQEATCSCNVSQIAVCMACPIVELHPERNELIVHGGGVHFSKDYLLMDDNVKCYGKAVALTGEGWDGIYNNVYLKSLSQEHGIAHAPTAFFENVNVGDVLGFLPVHSCLAADAMNGFMTLNGEQISMMPKTGNTYRYN